MIDDRPGLGGQPAHIVGFVQICGDETCFAASVFDIAHDLGAALGTASVHHDLGATISQLQGNFAANP